MEQMINWDKVHQLSGQQVRDMLSLLEPTSLKYSPHTPTPKQQVFMNLRCREAFFGGAAGGGKDIALDTPIYTPSGWKLMQDLHPGDYVYGREGIPVKILAESEVFKHSCYKVVFDNGEEIIAGATHVWSVVTANRMQRYKLTHNPHAATGVHMKNMTTEELVENLYCDTSSNTSRYRIPVAHPMVGISKLPIHPYILGYWLGDGTTEDGTITTQDQEVVTLIESIRPIHKAWQNSVIQYRIDGLRQELKQYNLFGNKHIPLVYLQASYEDRLELLRGLMDSDGTIEDRGVMCFCNTNKQLTDAVQTLLGTLGVKSGISVVNSTKETYEFEYRNTFSTTERVFNLSRKYNRQKQKLKGVENWFYIRNIQPIESVPTKCIKVDAADGLFRVGKSMVLTHNSDALLMDALQYSDVKGYAAILFRQTFADLVKPGALIDRAKEWLLRFDNVVWREKDRKFEFIQKYGKHTEVISILQFGYLENENDKYNYQGGEYQYAGFDELVHMSETNYKYIFSRLRRLKGADIPIKVRGTSNPPDDDQGIWVYNRFVNPETKQPNVIFVPAGMDDNPHLDAEEYREMLDVLDPVTRARLRDGVWTIIRKGNMFKREWFPLVDTLPPHRRSVRYWDMAATDAEAAKKKRKRADPDYTVGMKVSLSKGIFYIEDIFRIRKAPGATQQDQKVLAAQDGKRVQIRMEQEPGSSGVIAIKHYEENVFSGYNFQGIRSSGNKVERANPVSALAEAQKIKVLATCPNLAEFFGEAESFPGGAHDDMIDALSGAIGFLSATPSWTGQVPTIVGEQDSYWSESFSHVC